MPLWIQTPIKPTGCWRPSSPKPLCSERIVRLDVQPSITLYFGISLSRNLCKIQNCFYILFFSMVLKNVLMKMSNILSVADDFALFDLLICYLKANHNVRLNYLLFWKSGFKKIAHEVLTDQFTKFISQREDFVPFSDYVLLNKVLLKIQGLLGKWSMRRI